MACKTRRFIAALGLALLACDPGFSIHATVIVPEAVAAAYTPDQRGLLLVTIDADGSSSERQGVAVICGEGGSFDASYGSLGTLPDAIIIAWITPLPADDERPCGAVSEDSMDYVGDFDAAADEDPQARETITAESGCNASNNGEAELTLAIP